MTSPIHELMEQIREYVNNTWKHYQLRQDKALFSQLISALDTIEDAEEAILAFENNTLAESTGTLYLTIYGLLQAFFVQQDATQHLCEALCIQETYSNYPQLKAIREIRNDSVGNPTKREFPKSRPISYHQISRITMSKKGFQLLSHYSDGTRQFRDISIPGLISDQKKFIAEMLTRVIDELKAEVKAHKEKFHMQKLVNVFPSTLGYAFEKVSHVFYDGTVEIGRWGLEHIKTAFYEFHEAVGQRDMDAYEGLERDNKYIEHAIARLEKMLDAIESGVSKPEDECDGHIYISFLREQSDELQTYAKQIDEDYDSEEA